MQDNNTNIVLHLTRPCTVDRREMTRGQSGVTYTVKFRAVHACCVERISIHGTVFKLGERVGKATFTALV